MWRRSGFPTWYHGRGQVAGCRYWRLRLEQVFISEVAELGVGQLDLTFCSHLFLKIWHQLGLKWGRAFPSRRLRIRAGGCVKGSQVVLKVALDLGLKERRVFLVCFLLLIQQKFRQKHGVLSLILLKLFVKWLVFLDFIIQHCSHLLELVLKLLVLEVHFLDIFLHFWELSFLLESAFLGWFSILNQSFIFVLFWLVFINFAGVAVLVIVYIEVFILGGLSFDPH